MISKVLLRGAVVFGVLLCFAENVSSAERQGLLLSGIAEFNTAYSAWDYEGFTAAAATFQKSIAREPQNGSAYYWYGAAEFHRLLNLMGQKQTGSTKSAVSQAMRRAIDSLETALRLNDKDAESHILLSTLYGMSIAESPVRAVWLGASVMDHRNKALKLAPDNPRAYYLTGMSYYYAPEILGGKANGLPFLLKAEKLFEAEGKKPHDPVDPLWGYGSCLTFIGKTSQALGKMGDAGKYYRKALAVNPKDQLAQAGLESLNTKSPAAGKAQ